VVFSKVDEVYLLTVLIGLLFGTLRRLHWKPTRFIHPAFRWTL